jgi:hypothetical protein
LPTLNERAQGPVAIQSFVTGLLARVPDFRFENVRIWIETPDRVYAGVLVAAQGKFRLLHEALDTLAASRAFSTD